MTTVIAGGTVFDGSGRPGQQADVHIGGDGRVRAVTAGAPVPAGAHVVDATGCWVTPGFVDLHTHYDAEVELAPALTESVRHGVTTVLVGSCGLSMAVGDPEDLADMFCRVEGIPHSTVLPLLRDVVDWKDPAGYLDHLDGLPLGPNVTAMVGHSTIRAHVLGLSRSLDHSVRPSAGELDEMGGLVGGAVDAGFLGLSVNLLPWDKMGGSRFRSQPTPSVFAGFGEYRHLAEVLRRRGALFQAIPNLQTRWSIFPLMGMSTGVGRPALRTSLLTLVDAPPAMGAYKVIANLAHWLNRRARARIRFQSLPCPFDLYTDGLENPVMEELGAGTEALHLEDPAARAQLLREPGYRRRFRSQWRNKITGRAYHRNLHEARIVACPDGGLVGRTFAELATEAGVDPVDLFLDLQARFGNELRWYTVVGNANPASLEWIMAHPAAIIGFSDAGAHLRNMAYYNYPLRMLKRVHDAGQAGRPFMSIERAVHRLTGEVADFLGIDAGHLAVGRRADIAIIDPTGLTDAVEEMAEAPMPGFAGLQRCVRRNDGAVRAVFVNGRQAWDGQAAPDALGAERGFGQVLRYSSS